MENIEINQRAVQMVMSWDPFQLGEDSYDTEAADIVAALQGTTDVEELTNYIQQVYEFSFEEWIDIERCKQLATQLISLKTQCNL